jgi:hypothetical protein
VSQGKWRKKAEMKKNRIGSAFILLALLVVACDTEKNVTSPLGNYFVKFFGGAGNQTGIDFEVIADGTFVILGTTRSDSVGAHSQMYLVKSDATGNLIWSRTFGGPLDDEAADVGLTGDGRIMVLGNSYSSSGDRDLYLSLWAPDGSKIAERTINFTTATSARADDVGNSISQTNDGFIVAGSTDNLSSAVKPPPTRLALYARVYNDLSDYANWGSPTPTYGQGLKNSASDIYQVDSGAFVVFGTTNWTSKGGQVPNLNFWHFVIDPTGVTASDVGTDTAQNQDAILGDAFPIPASFGSSGYFLGGTLIGPTRNDLAVSSVDGNLTTKIGLTPLGLNLGLSSDTRVNLEFSKSYGVFVLTNEASSGNNNLLLIKLNPNNGKPAWASPAIYGGQGDDFAGAVHELPDGRIAIVGTMAIGQQNGETKMALIKVNKDGQFSD